MPLEQTLPADRIQHPCPPSSSLHDVHKATWAAGAEKPAQKQSSNALQGFGDFCIGFTDGLGHFVTETAQAAGQAITHPGETIHHAAEGTKAAIDATGKVVVAGSAYVADHVAHGDVVGMAGDAYHTGEAIGTGVAQSIDHFNHLSGEEKGYIFGHDVAPTVIGTVLAPELIPEGALAAGAAKVASGIGTLVKEDCIVAKVATTLENAREKMQTISDKMAALHAKMHAFAHGENDFVRATIETIDEPRLRHGKIVTGERMSESFLADLKKAQDSLNGLESRGLGSANFKPVHNMAEEMGKDQVFALGTWKRLDNTIRIAEHTGFETNLRSNNDIRHSLVHEIGHLTSDRLGMTGEIEIPVSSSLRFITQFEADLARNTAESQTASQLLEQMFPNIHDRYHEVFADMFAHASDEALGLTSTNKYAKILKAGFPNCLEFVKNFREVYKL